MERTGLNMSGGRSDISVRNGVKMGAHSEAIAKGPRQAIQSWKVGNGEPSERGDSSALKKHVSYY